MSDYNYQAYSPSSGQSCGHMHHSEKRAMNCAEHLGWTDAIPKKVRKPTFKRDSIPSYINSIRYDDTDVYESTITVRFVAKDNDAVAKEHEKILNTVRNVGHVVQAGIESTRKLEDEA